MEEKKIGSRIKGWFIRNGRLRPYVVPVVLMLVMAVSLGFGLRELAKTFSYNRVEISKKEEDLGIAEMHVPDGITSIALFGIDARNEDFRGLSDSIMIITIDSEHHCIKLTSVMRDSLVEVEGYGYQKINAAYNLGGPQLALKTLNQTFNLNIRNYATVDFVSMSDIIEAVGGVEVELTEAEVRNANIHIESMHRERGTALDYIEEPGLQKLNGVQAVAFARIRKVATINGTVDDGGRTERQRLVMHQLFDKALAMEIRQYPAMIKALLPCMETSLTYGEIFELAGILTQSDLEFKEARVPTNEMLINYGLYVRGLGSCKYYNLDYAADILNAFIFEDIAFEDYIAENGVDYTPWFYGETYDPNAEDAPEDEEEEPIEEENPIEGEDPIEGDLVEGETPEENTTVEDPTDEKPTGEDPEATDPEKPTEEEPTDPSEEEKPADPEGDTSTDPSEEEPPTDPTQTTEE